MSTFKNRAATLTTGSAFAAMALSLATPAQAIVPNDNYSPSDVIDDTGFNGVGMFYRNDGFVCTGSLINPRTVIFAAHCVNDLDESEYDTDDGLASAFSFDDNALPGFQNWIGNNFQSNAEIGVYNIGQISYNPESVERPEGFGFLEGDVAIASLSDRAEGIPTWTLLFSPLPDPGEIDNQTGTGYHVNITGYGRSGNGTDGDIQGIDWRRRAAENMLGAITSLDERNEFLFGGEFNENPQVLYHIDFDDPDRLEDGVAPNEFDFNLFKDDPLEREATTAGGDSGGPLILDAASNDLSTEDLIIGVLSGGSRFFGPQVFSSYGTNAFYQPLYLFWDYIAEANPYRYASSVEGNGRWTDPDHWVSTLDPAYRIIDDSGNVVNGIPTTPGAGITGTAPEFGKTCFETFDETGRTSSECRDGATGVVFVDDEPVADVAFSSETSLRGRASLGGSVSTPAAAERPQDSDGGPPEFDAGPLPDPTIENGLPGATGFVPNNVEPDPVNGVDARYFDVTLAADGTTRLTGRDEIEIDRLTLANEARLVITKRADMSVISDFTMLGGTLDVDGSMSTGESLVVGGLFRGRGVFDPTFLTFVGGTLQPDGNGLGTLTIRGDVILSSATETVFDIARNRNDLIVVEGDDDNFGIFAPAGQARIQRRTGALPRDGSSYTIVTAGRIAGEYDSVDARGLGVLQPTLSYDATSITVSLEAGSMAEFIGVRAAPAAVSFANALDSLRARNYDALEGVYGALDVMDVQSLSATLSGFAPAIRNETMEIGSLQNEQMLNLVTDRLSMIGTDRVQRGTFNVVGSPEALGIAAGGSSMSTTMASRRSFTGRIVSEGRTLGQLPENMSGFISGGYEMGRTATNFGGRNDLNATYHMAVGLEAEVTNNLTVGGATAMSQSRSSLRGSSANVRTNQAMAYASYNMGGGAYVAGLGSASISDIGTDRLADSGYETARFNNDTTASNYAAGVEAGVNLGIGRDFNLTPRVGLRYTHAEVDGYTETGSQAALQVDSVREQRLEGRVGFAFQGETTVGDGWTLRPQLSADYVRAVGGNDSDMTVRFANASGVPIVLPGFANDTSWAEVRGGLSVTRGNMSFTTAVETDVSRANMRDDRAVAEFAISF